MSVALVRPRAEPTTIIAVAGSVGWLRGSDAVAGICPLELRLSGAAAAERFEPADRTTVRARRCAAGCKPVRSDTTGARLANHGAGSAAGGWQCGSGDFYHSGRIVEPAGRYAVRQLFCAARCLQYAHQPRRICAGQRVIDLYRRP